MEPEISLRATAKAMKKAAKEEEEALKKGMCRSAKAKAMKKKKVVATLAKAMKAANEGHEVS